MAFTSAKSVLIKPGVVMRLVMPDTPCSNTSSAILKALSIDVFSFDTVRRRSFGMTISVSTFSLRRWMPWIGLDRAAAALELERPVTTPMVRALRLLATSAMTGAPPVPVPPPLPAVMNTMSAPLMTSSISSRCDSAAARPISGSDPRPAPS
jgi:hypothetical protein